MSPLARRGRRVYLALATLLIAWQLFNVGFHLLRGWSGEADIRWFRSVVLPLIFVNMVVALRTGDRLHRWTVAVWMWISGALPVYAAVMMTVRLLEQTPAGEAGFFLEILGLPLGILASIGLAEIALGCAVLWLPSLTAYFEERRAAASLFEVV